MAIINSFTHNGTVYPYAYIQVSIHRCDTSVTVLQLKVWANEETRLNELAPLTVRLADPLPTNLNHVGNPLHYAYDSIKNIPEFSEAQDV